MIKFINFILFLLLLNGCNGKPGTNSTPPASSSTPASNQTPPPPSDPDALAQADAQSKIKDAEAKIQKANAAKISTKADAKQLDLAITGVEKVIAAIKPFTKKADIDPEVGNLNLRLVDLAAALESFLKAKAIEKADTTDATADQLIIDAENIAKDAKVDAIKQQELKESIKEINKTKKELKDKKAEPTATAKDLETLENKLSEQSKELKTKTETAAKKLLSPEQTKAREQAKVVADSAETPLNAVEDILKVKSLSSTADLNNKHIALGEALVDFNNLSVTASKADIDAAKENIAAALTALKESKDNFKIAEQAAVQKAEEERLAKKNIATLIAKEAEKDLDKVKDILSKATLSDATDLMAKQKTLEKVIFELNNLPATASKDDIDAVQNRIASAHAGLNGAKIDFDKAEKAAEAKRLAAEQKAKKEDQARKEAEEKTKKEEEARKLAAATKKDFPYTLLTLEGGNNLLIGAQQMVSQYSNDLGLMLSTNYSANELYVIGASNRSNKIAVYKPGNNNAAIQLTAENSNYTFAKVLPHATLEKIIVHSIQKTGYIRLNDNDIYIGNYVYFNKNIFLSSDKDLISFNDKNIQIIKNNNDKYDEESIEYKLEITSAVALKNKILLTADKPNNNIFLYDNDILNPTNLTDNIKDKIKEKTVNNKANVLNIKLLSIANNTLFVTYEQVSKVHITTCDLNDEQNSIISCNEKPLLLGIKAQITSPEVSVAKDLQSALIYNIGKGLIFYKDNILTKIISAVEPTKDMPIKTSSVEGLNPEHICGSVFTAGVNSAAKVGDTWYVYADKNGVSGTARDGAYKICKIKEETIEP